MGSLVIVLSSLKSINWMWEGYDHYLTSLSRFYTSLCWIPWHLGSLGRRKNYLNILYHKGETIIIMSFTGAICHIGQSLKTSLIWVHKYESYCMWVLLTCAFKILFVIGGKLGIKYTISFYCLIPCRIANLTCT